MARRTCRPLRSNRAIRMAPRRERSRSSPLPDACYTLAELMEVCSMFTSRYLHEGQVYARADLRQMVPSKRSSLASRSFLTRYNWAWEKTRTLEAP